MTKHKKAKKEKPLATLTNEELYMVKAQGKIVMHRQAELNMLFQAKNLTWSNLKDKYNLPDEITLDDTTGEIYAKENGDG